MPKITINQWGGGIASHYHTGQENQCADMRNISVTAHPDAIMLANGAEKMLEAGGKISCGFHLKEFIKKDNIGMIVATENGEIWYNNQKIHTETGRVYRQVFYDVYTAEKIKRSGIFLIHNTGIDRYEYDKNTNTFINFTKNVDKFSLEKPNDDVKNFPILRVNNQVFIGWGNKIIVWDGVIFQKELNFSDITRIVGLSAYGDYVHIYATDGENSYKWIYDPVRDNKQP
jgi:hypothetical protein